MGKYAATQHLEQREHILLFHGIFDSNLRKAFFGKTEGGLEREGKERLLFNRFCITRACVSSHLFPTVFSLGFERGCRVIVLPYAHTHSIVWCDFAVIKEIKSDAL